MSEISPNDVVSFLASLPPSAGAIAIDGGDREGGRLKLDVPGTELASLLRLTTLRGRVLLVTIAPQATALALGPVVPDGEARAFPQDPLFQAAIADQARRTAGVGEDVAVTMEDIDGPVLPAHVHRYKDDACLECGAPREAGVQDAVEFARLSSVVAPIAPKPRKVRRGLIPKGRVKAKR